MNYKMILFLIFFGSVNLVAQGERYSLEDCINIALQNNFDLKSAELRTETATVNYKQNRNAFLPSVNGNYNFGVSSGRSIDPFTNDFVNERLTFSNAGLNLDATVFNGFRILNSYKQARLDKEASEMETAAAQLNLKLDVTLAFLQVLNARDLVKLTEARIGSTDEQLTRLKSLYDEESGNPVEYRDLQGQITNDKAAFIATKNDLKAAELNLNVLLNSETNIAAENMDILIDFSRFEFGLEEVMQQALISQPAVQASNLRLEAAEKGVVVAKAQYIPEVNLFANLGTNYSSAARLFETSGTSIQETGDFVTIEGQDISVFTEQSDFSSTEISYGDQFDNNLNTVVGVAVNVPVFNGFRAKNNVALEKIKKEEALVAVNRTKRELQQAIEQSYNSMTAAYDRHQVLQEQVSAYEESFRINEVRFENGVSTSVDYVLSKNNLDNARVNLASVKYEYELRRRILELYR